MARPKPVYRGKRKYGWLISLGIFLLIFALMAGIWVFYDLQKYIVYGKDGLSLDLSGSGIAVEENVSEDDSILADPVTDPQVVVELPDFSDMESRVSSDLDEIQALYVSADNMTAQDLSYYPSILADSPVKYNALVLNIKGDDGLLRYFSTIPMVGSYGVNGTESLGESLATLKQSGIWLVAEVSCLADSAMAVRNAPLSLKNAMGGTLTDENGSWLDPYNSGVRGYLTDMMDELKEMGFDEVLFTNLRLPAGMTIQYSQPMTAMPDTVSAVSSLGSHLRDYADEIGIYVSAELDGKALRESKGAEIGQDAEFFFKVFDRVYVRTDMDYYTTDTGLAMEIGDNDTTRVVTAVEGFNLPSGSYFVR